MKVEDLERAAFQVEHLLSGLDEDMGIEYLKAEAELLTAAARFARLANPTNKAPNLDSPITDEALSYYPDAKKISLSKD